MPTYSQLEATIYNLNKEIRALEKENKAMRAALIERENKKRGLQKKSDGFIMKSKSYSYHKGRECFMMCYETSYPSSMEIGPFLSEVKIKAQEEAQAAAGENIWVTDVDPFVMYDGTYWHLRIYYSREWSPNVE